MKTLAACILILALVIPAPTGCPACTPRMYLPIIQNSRCAEVENNDVPLRANELCPVTVGHVWPAGDADWFRLDLPHPSQVTLSLWAPAGVDDDLLLYPLSADWPIAQSTPRDGGGEWIDVILPAGQYYVLVAPFSGLSEQPYEVHITQQEQP